MLLFLDNSKVNLDFFQVFIEDIQVYSDEEGNIIYSFDSSSQSEMESKSKSKLNLNLDLNQYKFENICCKIKMIDSIISYDILTINKNFVFTTKTNFIEPSDNQFALPIFSHTYKQVNTKKLPNLIESKYTNIYTLNFKIYNLDLDLDLTDNDKIQYVIETNPETNLMRKYFITTKLSLIQKFFL